MKEVYCDTCYYCIKSKSKFKCILPDNIKLKVSTSECIKEPDITTCSAHKSRNLKMKNEYFMNQLSIFDLIPEEESKEADICESCRYNEKGCCSYDEPLGRYCVEGSAYELKVPEKAPQFPEADFAEIVNYINRDLGLNFQRRDGLEKTSSDDPEPSNYYEAKAKKGLRLSLSKGKFFPDVYGGAYYIGVGYDISNGGGGSAVDTVEEAIEYLRDKLDKYT